MKNMMQRREPMPAKQTRHCGETGKIRLAALLLPILLTCLPGMSAAWESLYIHNGDGNVVFRLDLFVQGEAYWDGLDDSARDFSAAEIGAMRQGFEYWTAVLKPTGAPFTPVVARAGVDQEQEYNAAAVFYTSTETGYGRVYEALEAGDDLSLQPSGLPGDPLGGAHLLTFINNYSWDTQPDSQLPETAGTLAPTIIHEIGHALGIAGDNDSFTQYLAGDKYVCPEEPGTLVFQGTEARKVFGGDIPMAHTSDQEASHFGLRNGLMTHAQITNYPMFMEAELAALQDIGYTIDRRGFFGLSLYATEDKTEDGYKFTLADDGDYEDFYANQAQTNPSKTIVNNVGFFHSLGLNANGDWLGYDKSRPNTNPFGVGLHIYGDDYTVTQKADLLAFGGGGAGVRIDGFRNTVNIPEGVTVAADGERGTGILVSFGSGHTVNSRGTVSATGPLGVAARFDMGAPYVDVNVGVLQSYGTYPNVDSDYKPPNDIGGPMVDAFNVSGPLLGGPSAPDGQWLSGEYVNYGGREIAVYIGPHAHVGAINILNGAEIRGDIISRWDPDEHGTRPPGNDGMTALTFGLEKDDDGSATGNADPYFSLRYRGNITGPASLKVSLEGGTLDYAGAIAAKSFEMQGGTTLLADFVGGNPGSVSAETIELETDSRVGFNPAPFAYGKRLKVGHNPLLVLDGDSLTNDAALMQSAGAFAVGPYDYTWQGLSWGADDSVRVHTTSRAFNHQRGGTDAQNAPLAIVARQPGLDAVNDRMTWRFSRGAPSGPASGAAALLGAPRQGDLHQGGAGFGGGEWGRFGRIGGIDLLSDRPRLDVEWLPLSKGGREASTGRTGLWVASSYSLTSHHGNRDFHIRRPNVTAGIDYQFTESWYLGLALALDFPRYDSDDAELHARSTTGILYSGIRLPLELELGLSASFGGTHFKQKRDVAGERYSSKFNNRTLGIGAMLGRGFQAGENILLRPFAAWDRFDSRRSAHDEGGGMYALRYDSARNSLYLLRAGADAAFVFDRGHVSARAYWYGLRGETTEHALASFALDPDHNSFAAPVDGLDRNSLGLAMNFGYRLGESTELTLKYSWIGGHETTSRQGMIGLRMRF